MGKIRVDLDQHRASEEAREAGPAAAERCPAPRLRFRSAAAVIDEPAPVALVEGIVWADCLTILAAESGAGKTFLLIDLAAAVAAGLPWYGRQTTQGTVAYLTFEGNARGLRLRAARDVRGHRLDDLYDLRLADPLSPVVTRDAGERPSPGEADVTAQLDALTTDLAHRGRPPIRLLIVDTVRASLAGSEDSSTDVSYYLRAVKRILATVPGAAAILAHHAGWQDGETKRKRERGSSAWRGNGDGTLYLEAGEYDRERGEKPLTLIALKVRDGEIPPPLRLVLRRVELGIVDRRGRGLTSCVVDADHRSQEDVEAASAAAGQVEAEAIDRRVLRVINDRPDLTSQDNIRIAVGVRKAAVSSSLARLIRRGYVSPGRQRHPYTLTDAGRRFLAEGTTTRVVPESFPLVPGTVPSGSPGSPLWGTGNDSTEPMSSSHLRSVNLDRSAVQVSDPSFACVLPDLNPLKDRDVNRLTTDPKRVTL